MRKFCWVCVSVAALSGCGSGVDGSPFEGSMASGASAPSDKVNSSASSEPAASASAPASGSAPAAPAAPPAAASTPASSANSEGAKEVPLAPAANASGGSAPSAPPSGQQTPPPSDAPNSNTPAANTPTPQNDTPPASASAADVIQCASYDTGFLPLVQAPVCSNCHGGGGRLPSFASFASARSLCTQIGREVSSGAMPPGGGLSNEQRATVASWVGGGCPETAADAAQSCAPANTSSPNPSTPTPAASGNSNPNAPAAAPARSGDDDGERENENEEDDEGGRDDD